MTRSRSDMAPVLVTLDGSEHLRGIPAYVIPGNRWNGWECPYFEVSTIRAYRAAWMRHAREVEESNTPDADCVYTYGWDVVTDLPIARTAWEDGTTDDDGGTVTTDDGVVLVTLGYAAWCWYAVSPDFD